MAIGSAGFHHPQVRRARLLHLKKHRAEERCFLVEGQTLVTAAVAATATIRTVFVRADVERSLRDLVDRIVAAGGDAYQVDERTMSALSQTRSPQGIVAIVDFVERELAALDRLLADERPALLLVIHDVADPGNVGTLIRCAEAFGVTAALCGPTSADPYNDKVVRSTAGALFRVPIVRYSDWAALRSSLSRLRVRILAAEAAGLDVRDAEVPARSALVIGHERHGLQAIDAADVHARLAVPHAPASESLNAGIAGAILLYELSRKLDLAR